MKTLTTTLLSLSLLAPSLTLAQSAGGAGAASAASAAPAGGVTVFYVAAGAVVAASVGALVSNSSPTPTPATNTR